MGFIVYFWTREEIVRGLSRGSFNFFLYFSFVGVSGMGRNGSRGERVGWNNSEFRFIFYGFRE